MPDSGKLVTLLYNEKHLVKSSPDELYEASYTPTEAVLMERMGINQNVGYCWLYCHL